MSRAIDLDATLIRASAIFRAAGVTGASVLLNECFPTPPPADALYVLAARVLDRAASQPTRRMIARAGDLADALLALARIGSPFRVTEDGITAVALALDAASLPEPQPIEDVWRRAG